MQLSQGLIQIKRLLILCGKAELFSPGNGQTTDRFFGVLHDHLVDAGLFGGCGAAEGDRATGMGLQVQRDFFQGLGHAGWQAWVWPF